MKKVVGLIPAYGIVLNSELECRKHFDSGKDFLIMDIAVEGNGSYCNKEELNQSEFHICKIRSNGKVFQLKIK